MSSKDEEKITSVGSIGNYYGGLHIKSNTCGYYWSIENWDGHHWQKISKELYQELLKMAE